ncbi:MAG TPA: DUF4388 domain-containing protein [Planctomycetota bacterium]|jgi:hypothetical protein|nr:DUF4388 domain-containing protein [Planctomycetota bacterium]
MGTLRGDISVLGVANLLQSLALGKCAGHLTLEAASHEKVFHLDAGRIRLVRGSRRCQRLEKLLKRVGPVNREGVGRIVAEWTLDEVADLLTWTRGTFRFQEGAELPKGVIPMEGLDGWQAEADILGVILEGARRVDLFPRIRTVLPDMGAVPDRDPSSAAFDASGLDPGVAGDVLPLVDGKRSVGTIVLTSAYPRTSVLEVVYQMALQGAVRLPTSTSGLPLPEVA